MDPFTIYVTEPAVIDMAIVTEALGDTPHTLVAGSADFATGDCSKCNTALIRSGTHIDATIRDKMPQLQHVVRVGVGLDNVDLDFCKTAGIAVYNAPGANADAVAEYATGVILTALRNIPQLTRTDQEQWNRHKFTGHSIAGRTVGIVGFGNIGRLLYGKLRALGCNRFMIYDPFATEAPEQAELVPLDTLLAGSDIISLHLPLIPQTTHLINAEKLALLKENTILLNAARGGIVDEAALLDALQTKPFTYIADTVEGEPHPNPALLDSPHVMVTPHIASLTAEAEDNMIRVAIEHLIAGKTAQVVPA